MQDRAITRDLDWGIEIPVDDLGSGKKYMFGLKQSSVIYLHQKNGQKIKETKKSGRNGGIMNLLKHITS